MNVTEYFESLSLELNSLKNRLRNFIGNHHWPTDGEWKESVLRTILRRHLPHNVGVGRGFVIKPNGPSKQIDVLIYDTSKPILYKDGDLVIITGDAVKGIIEVKSNVRRNELPEILEKLAGNAEFVYESLPQQNNDDDFFVGLFSYDTQISKNNSMEVLEEVKKASKNSRRRIVNHLCLGDSFFIRFWKSSPNWQPQYYKWHSYELRQKAPGYFINNVVDSLAQQSVTANQHVWFPTEGKEDQKLDEIHMLSN